jgi:hypothetical protein
MARVFLGRQLGNVDTSEECEILRYNVAGIPQFADNIVDVDGRVRAHLEA